MDPALYAAVVSGQQVVVLRQKQAHGAPALLSFFLPGLGQLVKGQIVKGLATFVVMGFSALLIFVGIGLVTTPLLWILQVWDAYSDN